MKTYHCVSCHFIRSIKRNCNWYRTW